MRPQSEKSTMKYIWVVALLATGACRIEDRRPAEKARRNRETAEVARAQEQRIADSTLADSVRRALGHE